MTLEEMAARIAVQAAELQRLRAAVVQQRLWIRELLANERRKQDECSGRYDRHNRKHETQHNSRRNQ